MSTDVGLGLLLALGSAATLNWSYYVQHGAAAGLPRLSLRRPLCSLALLFRNRRWLIAFFTGIGGWVLYVRSRTADPVTRPIAAVGIAVAARRRGLVAIARCRCSASGGSAAPG